MRIFLAVLFASLTYANAADSTLPITSYRSTILRQCGTSSVLYRLKSHHVNSQEDRQWTLVCKSSYALTTSAWTGYVNSWDGVLNYRCPTNRVMTGLYSFYNTHKKDRLWKIKCSQLSSAHRLHNCMITPNYVNGWDAAMNFTAAGSGVITGLYSVHDNNKEDRRWMVYHCAITTAKFSSVRTNLAITNWDDSHLRQCGANSVLYRFSGYYDTYRKDRRFTYFCKSGYTVTSPVWTGYLNQWDGVLNYRCGTNRVVTGLGSYHNNHKEDRRWRIRCSLLPSSIRLQSCVLSGYINSWRNLIFYSVAYNHVIQGFNSYHTNTQEDRLWRIYHCATCSAKKDYGAWSAWSACTKPCTGSTGVSGTQTRRRHCALGTISGLPRCPGISCTTEVQTQKCNMQRCKVNGGFSAWSAYSACSATCGPGRKTRTRQCNNPAPAYGGANCVGPNSEFAVCKVRDCPVNGGFGAWSAYSACSATCGTGRKTRTRQCNNPAPAFGGRDCIGPKSESAVCKVKDCPVNGGFGAWSAYSACSATCGAGRKTRTRQCNNPAPAFGGRNCDGPKTETAVCKVKDCPVNGGFGAWSAYSACSATCGAGRKTRSRQCNNPAPAFGGRDCVGPKSESAVCKVKDCHAPKPVNGKFGPWSAYSTCSATCGKGKKTRTRQCNNPAPAFGGRDCVGPKIKTMRCKMGKCETRQDCSSENGMCRQGGCLQGEKKAGRSKQKCKALNNTNKDGKPFRCCIKS